MDFIQLFPYLAGLVFTAILILIIYWWWYRPRQQEPLPNETSVGYVEIWLKEKGVAFGPMCTAQQTVGGYLLGLCESEEDATTKKNLESMRKEFARAHIFAHRVEGETRIYLFNENPLDQRFMSPNPRNNSSIITGVQDVLGAGSMGGMTVLAVKLGAETRSFSDEERANLSSLVDVAKYVRDAARNIRHIASLKEENGDLRNALDKATKEVGEKTALLDRAVSALSKKPLTVEDVKVPGEFTAKLKQWFSTTQIITGVVGYLAAPYIVQFLNWNLLPPLTTYFTAFAAVMGFFAIPIGKRLFGRWL